MSFSSRLSFFLLLAPFLLVFGIASSLAASPATNEWDVAAYGSLPPNTQINDCKVGGLSGISFDAKTGIFWTVSDGRIWHDSKIFFFRIKPNGENLEVSSVGSLSLQSGKNTREPLDSEGIALWTQDRFFVSHEGSKSGALAPGIACFHRKSGKPLFSLPVPSFFYPSPDGTPSGLQNNRGFEALCISRPQPNSLYSCIESPLIQDLSNPNDASSGPVRILRYRLNSPESLPEQRAYQADRDALFGSVPDILSISETRLLVLERQIVWPLPPMQRRIRLYEIDFSQPTATDVSNLSSLANQPVTPLTKKLVFDSDHSRRLHEPDNIEGISWGPSVNGSPTLVLVSDDNFSKSQKTEFVLLKKIR